MDVSLICRFISLLNNTHCSNPALILQLLTSRRRQHSTIHRLHPGAPTTSRIHLRASTSRTRFNVYCAVLRRAILGTQFFLRAHVFCAFARLGTHCRDSKRRERKQPREDFRLDRAMGSRAQETSAWGRPISHFGVLVKAKVNLCMSDAAQSDTDRQRFAAAAVVHQNQSDTPLHVRICVFMYLSPISSTSYLES
jgi:hypothetical protein